MSDLGGFSQCMVGGDGIGRPNRVRGGALAASVFLETGVIVGVLLWPLISPAVLPQQQFVITPVPPYFRVSNSSPAQSPEAAPTTAINRKLPNVFSQPAFIPPNISHASDDEGQTAPLIGDRLGEGNGEPGIPGLDDDRRAITIVPPAPESRPRMVSRGVMDALLIHRVQPGYPAPAKMMHLSGIVQLRAVIGTDGGVRALEVVSGSPILAQAAVAAVRQWRYQPTRLNGAPVEVQTQITVTFVLE